MNGDIMSEETKESGGGTLAVAGHLKHVVNDLKKHLFPEDSLARDVHLFAISIGIEKNQTLQLSDWKRGDAKAKSNPGSHINTIPELEGLKVLLQYRGDLEDGVQLNTALNEYLNGGLTWLKSEEIHKGSIDILIKKMPKLFGSEKE